MSDNMEQNLHQVSHNGDNSNQTEREGEVSYVKSVINFYERKENVASRPFSAGSRNSNDLKSSRSSGTTINTTTTTTTDISTNVVVTNDVTTSDIQEIAADVPISNSSDYDSNGIIPLNTEKSDDDHSGNNSSDHSDPQCQVCTRKYYWIFQGF